MEVSANVSTLIMKYHLTHFAWVIMSAGFLHGFELKDWKFEGEVDIPKTIRVERDITYLPPERKEKADLYFPTEKPAEGRFSIVLLMHGGGFNDGDKARGREIQMAVELAKHGYACMSINYKLWNKGIKRPTWPQSLHDAKTAVRWLRVNADRLGIDPERIAAFGNSAGGNLALMLASTTAEDGLEPAEPHAGISTRVRCAVDLYGALDLPNYHDMKMFQQSRDENPEVYRKASPVTYASAGDAPMLIVHGTADETVHVSQAETMAAALAKAGVEHQLEIVPDAPHTFYLISKARDFRPLIFAFLDRHLGQGS
jgi:acetyl esterase/lipase